jgi:hypothetical protein
VPHHRTLAVPAFTLDEATGVASGAVALSVEGLLREGYVWVVVAGVLAATVVVTGSKWRAADPPG